ncbi:unnamed protein product [Dicrocoelium dendriticum]|nr:unnamed protein product [Dicrocoelium dendriticum]
MPERKALIKSADMSEEMQQEAADCCGEALDRFTMEKDIAAFIKKEFDRIHGATWHCVVGKQFGSYVTHEKKHFIYFHIDDFAVLLYKSG